MTTRRPTPTSHPARPPRFAPPLRGASFFIGVVAFLVYLSMTPAASGDKDGSEFTLVLATLGAAHPTGYALYTIVGHGFVRLAHTLGASWPLAANAFSGLGGAVAVGLLHSLADWLLRRIGVTARSAALLASLPAIAFGMNPIWTMETTLAEVNSWHVAWVMALTLFAATELAARTQDNARVHATRTAAIGGLLLGVGLTHHLTSVWFSIPFGLAVFASLKQRTALTPRAIAAGIGAFALALSTVGYVFWRASHPALMQWPVLGPATAWDHVLGAQYRGYLGHFAPSQVQQRFLRADVYPWLVPALLALLALALRGTSAIPRAWRFAAAAAALIQTVYVFSYGVPDPSPYFLPVLALGLAAVPAALAQSMPLLRRHGAWLAGIAAVVLLLTSVTWMRLGRERASTYERFDELVHQMWMSVPFEEGFVIWGDDMVHRLTEYQLLRGEKPRVIALNPAQLTYPGPHDAFIARHGFDPLEDLPPLPPPVDDPSTRALYEAIAERINRASPLPLVVFDPAGRSVRMLRKVAVSDSTTNH